MNVSHIKQIFIRIKKTRIKVLFKSIFFKILYFVYRLFDKIQLFFRPSKLHNYQVEGITANINIEEYIQFCDFKESKQIQQKADRILNNYINLFGKEYFLKVDEWLKDPISGKKWDNDVYFYNAKVECVDFGDVKLVMEYNKMYHLVILSKAFYITKDERYLEKIEQSLLGWLSIVKQKKSVVNRIMLDKAFRSINLLHVSFLCIENDYFKSKIFPLIINILVNEEEQISAFSTPRWFKMSTGTNHTIGEMVGLITTQLFLQYFTKMSYSEKIKKELNYLNLCLENIITDKDVYLEQSGNYSRLVAEFLVFLDIVNSVFEDRLDNYNYKKKYLKSMLNYINILSFNGKLPNFGDNDGAKVLLPFYNIQNKGIKYLIKYYQYRFSSHHKSSKTKALVCNRSGQFIWNSNDLYCHIRSGMHSYFPPGSSSHAHNDLLSINLSLKGKEFLIDKGTYLYNSGMKIRNNDRSTASHNTVAIEEVEQANFMGKWAFASKPSSRIEYVSYNNSKMYFKGNISYGGYSHSRAILYEASKFEIHDQINATKRTSFSINFLFAPEFQITRIDKSNQFNINNGKDVFTTMSFDSNLSIQVIEEIFSPNYGEKLITSKIEAKATINSTSNYITTIIIS